MPTGFPNSPRLVRGGIVTMAPDASTVQTVIALQYNPDSLTRRKPYARTIFFTDRAIYRPGQTIQYKAICLWADPTKDNYETLKGEEVTVIFHDVSGKEIARQKQRAN